MKVKDDRTLAGIAQYNRLLAITPSPLEWQAAKEAEAGLRACTCQIVLSETETSWTAGMKGPVQAKLKNSFKQDAMAMAIDLTLQPWERGEAASDLREGHVLLGPRIFRTRSIGVGAPVHASK